MIYEQIKEDMNKALKEGRKEARATLGYLYSQLKNKCIELHVDSLQDTDVISVIQKVIKGLQEEKEWNIKANKLDAVQEFDNSRNLLTSYLPVQLTEDEIRTILSFVSDKSIPFVMKYFKENFAGQVDMKLVNSIVKEL